MGIEPTFRGFADLSLTTWVPRPIPQDDRWHSLGNTRFQLGQTMPGVTAQASEIGAGDGT